MFALLEGFGAGAVAGALVAVAGAGVGFEAGAEAGAAEEVAALAANQVFTPWCPRHAPFFVAVLVYEPSLHCPVEPAGAPAGA